jgi:hypothetical protein
MNRDEAAQAVAEATAEVIGRDVPEDEWSDDAHSQNAEECVALAIKRLAEIGHEEPEANPQLWVHVVAMATVTMLTDR